MDYPQGLAECYATKVKGTLRKRKKCKPQADLGFPGLEKRRTKECKNDLRRTIGRMRRWIFGPACNSKLILDRRQPRNHAVARWAVRNNLVHLSGYIYGRKVMLHQFRNDLFPGDQVDHGKIRHFNSRLSQEIGKRRYPVDHHER